MSKKVTLNYTKRDDLTPRLKAAKEKLFATAPHIDTRKLIIETDIYQKKGESPRIPP